MKLTFIFIVIVTLSMCWIKKPSKKPEIVAKTILKGVFDIPKDSTGRRIYLLEFKVYNNSNSTVEFLAYHCTPVKYIVFDSKDIIPAINNCAANYLGSVSLKSNQEFSLDFLITSNKRFPDSLKIGWKFVTIRDYSFLKNCLSPKVNSEGEIENILWSDPIHLGNLGGYPYEVK